MRRLITAACLIAAAACGGRTHDGHEAPEARDAGAVMDAGTSPDSGEERRSSLPQAGEEYRIGAGATVTFVGENGGANRSFRVLLTGDMDGDGLSEVVVSDSDYSAPGDEAPRGAVYLFYGDPGLEGEVALESADAILQGGVSGITDLPIAAGDLDGDGYRDLVIGDVRVDCDESGRAEFNNHGVVIIHGGPDRLLGARRLSDVGLRLTAGERCQWAGLALEADADIDGDGFDDLVLGAPLEEHEEGAIVGAVHVIYGTGVRPGPSPIDALDTRTIHSASADWGLGVAVDAAGDTDGDGVGDLLVGRFLSGSPTPYGVYLLHGSRSRLPASSAAEDVAHLWEDADPFRFCGDLDTNGDAHAEVVVDVLAPALLWGESDRSTGIWTFLTTPEFGADWSGVTPFWCTNAGDMDGDGASETFIGFPQERDGMGTAYVLLGPVLEGLEDLPLSEHAVTYLGDERHVEAHEGLGATASGDQDVDGDGLMDLIIGEPAAGRAFLITAGEAP